MEPLSIPPQIPAQLLCSLTKQTTLTMKLTVIPQVLFDDAFPAGTPTYDVPLRVNHGGGDVEYPLQAGAAAAYGSH